MVSRLLSCLGFGVGNADGKMIWEMLQRFVTHRTGYLFSSTKNTALQRLKTVLILKEKVSRVRADFRYNPSSVA